jgi:hypothetical protein
LRRGSRDAMYFPFIQEDRNVLYAGRFRPSTRFTYIGTLDNFIGQYANLRTFTGMASHTG